MDTINFEIGENIYKLPKKWIKRQAANGYSSGAQRLQIIYKFPNGLGLSVIYDGLLSYGRQKDLLEACVIEFLDDDDFVLNYSHNREIKTDDLDGRLENSVFAFCTNDDIDKLIERVKGLK